MLPRTRRRRTHRKLSTRPDVFSSPAPSESLWDSLNKAVLHTNTLVK